jgi:hypothetical protein
MATAKAVKSQSKSGTGTGKKNVQEEDENRPTKPKKLSKAGLWRLAHPNGVEGTYDRRAVMR